MACALSLSTFAAVDSYLTLDSPVQTNGIFGFTLNGQFGTRYVIEASTDLQTWAPILTNDGPDSARALTTSVVGDSAFYRAKQGPWVFKAIGIVVRTNITLSGNSISIDSFDSSDITNFPGGLWNAFNRRAHGNVASRYGTIGVGNATIMGKVFTGPAGNVSMGPNGSVGDVAWTTGGNAGIEPGWSATNFSLFYPDVIAPYTSGTTPTGSGTNTYILNSGQYKLDGDLVLTSGHNLVVNSFQFVQLYVTGNVQMSATSSINIMFGGVLQLYVGGASATLTQVKNSGIASGFQYYGLPNNLAISWVASDPVATVYAPEANLTLNASGGGSADLSGALILNSLTINSHVNFHYDENLAH
jgi:hypothetical protein